MSAKNLLVAAVITSLLAGCGGNAYQAPLPDGTYDSAITPAEEDYASGDYTGDTSGDYTGEGDQTSEPGDADTAVDGYTLKGFVSDASGKAIEGATVSIIGQSTLTDKNGLYSLIKIDPATKVFVSVTKTGYDPVQNATVEFTDETPSQTKDFKLALTGDDDEESSSATAGFNHEMTFSSKKSFKSVSAMVVDGGNVYVLGVLDGLLFDSTVVTVFTADTGEEVSTFKKVGLFTSLPKDATRLKVDGDEILVSNGSDRFSFSPTGTFLKKDASGASYALVTEVTDEDRDIKYKIDGTKIEVTYDGDKVKYSLDELGKAKALGLDEDGNLLVLDSTNSVVQQYSFETGD